MDIYCPVCGEPWEIDSLHDEISARGYDYQEAVDRLPNANERQQAYEREWFDPIMKAFKTKGCGDVFDNPSCKPRNTNTTAIAQAAFDLMGDDVDGIASMMDDAEYMGMLDK